MKKNIFIILILMVSLFSGCENELKKNLEFEVSVAPAAQVQIGDSVVTAAKGTTLKFDFAGEPDFISFSYVRFNPTKTVLSFTAQPAWGTHIQNTLNVFISESISELVLNNAKTDSATIAKHAWTDITTLCNLPSTANTTNKAAVSLNEYRGKKVSIAFRYKTEFAADWQPTWTIANLQLADTLVGTNIKTSSTPAAALGFSPFDMMNMNNPYLSADAAGVWNLTNSASIVIKRSTSGSALNTDWLVSKPVEISRGVNTLSEKIPVRNITNNVSSYSHLFSAAGEYTVTFAAANRNYLYQESTEKTIKIIITD